GCASTQRRAILSYWAIGSPLLEVSQGPPKPAHKVFPALGPYTKAPLALSKMANSTLTHWTYWVAPAAPLVSGGVQPFAPTPSELTPALGGFNSAPAESNSPASD